MNVTETNVTGDVLGGGTVGENSLESYYEGDNDSKVLFEFVLHGIFTSLICVVGFVGNVISIAILSRPQMKSSTNLILCALSLFDCVVIATSMMMFSFPAVYRYTQSAFFFTFYYRHVFPYIIPSVYPLGLIAQTGSVYCTLCVTIERYIVICWPLRASEIITYGRTKVSILIIFLFSVGYNFSRFFEISWIEVTSEGPDGVNVTRIETVPTPMRLNTVYIGVYITWMYLVFMYMLPFGGLSVLNMLMFLDVRRSNSRNVTLSSHQRKEMKLAVMLMIVVLVFLICNVLPFIVNIMELFSLSYKPLTEISNLLVAINSSVNIFIYTMFGEKFQRQLVRYLGRFCPCLLTGKFAAAAAAHNLHYEFTKSEYHPGGTMNGRSGGGSASGPRCAADETPFPRGKGGRTPSIGSGGGSGGTRYRTTELNGGTEAQALLTPKTPASKKSPVKIKLPVAKVSIETHDASEDSSGAERANGRGRGQAGEAL